MKLYDSLSKEKKEISKGEVRIYGCGPTVYDFIHIGNTRPIFVTDVLIRTLSASDHSVNYLMNITDIDDKIINQALKTKTSETSIAKKFTEAFLNDLNNLKVVSPNKIISISDKINVIIEFIDELVREGSAYFSEGNVYFDVDKYKDEYGKISHQKLDELFDGVRIENDSKKRTPLDFSLWKITTEGRNFLTKWSQGRPGWHTECVALIEEYFKKPINIHIGGTDLRFPHHENERIQFYAKHEKELSDVWFHVGHVLFENQKMSKSIGNIITVKDFLKENSANDLRYIMLVSGYSQPVNITPDLIEQAKKWNDRNQKFLTKINWMLAVNDLVITTDVPIDDSFNVINFGQEAMECLNDDLNTAKAISIVDLAVKYLNNKIKTGIIDSSYVMVKNILSCLGFDYDVKILESNEIDDIKKWKELVKEQKFDEADSLRKKLMKKNII